MWPKTPFVSFMYTRAEHSAVGILVQATIVYRRIRIGQDEYLDQAEA